MLADRFYSNLSSDSDSDIDQNLDKLKDLFTRKKTLNKHLTATSPRYSTFERHYKNLGRFAVQSLLQRRLKQDVVAGPKEN